jgi:CHASE1-domain containing sensor protein
LEKLKQRWTNRPNISWRIAVLFFVLYFVVARGWTWEAIGRTNSQTSTNYFNRVVRTQTVGLSNRFEIYADALYSGQALLRIDPSVSRQDWTDFVDSQHITQRYPGVNGLSYVSVIPRSQVPSLTEELNASRLPTEHKPVSVYPSSNDSQLAVITYLAPESISQSPIGYDMFTSAARKKTLDTARDTGKPQSSTPLALVTDKQGASPSFLLVMPVYKPSAVLKTVAERRAAIEGYVVLSLHSRQLLDSVFQTNTQYGDIELTASTDNEVIYQTGAKPGGQTLHRTVNIDVAGQTWQLDFITPADFGLSNTAKIAKTFLLVSSLPLVIIIVLMSYYGVRLRTLRAHHDNHHRGTHGLD